MMLLASGVLQCFTVLMEAGKKVKYEACSLLNQE